MTYAFPLPIPTLTTDRLILRPPHEADFTAMLAFNDSPRAGFVGGGGPRQQVWRGLLANIGHWALRGYGFFSVDSRDGDFIGRVGVIYHDGWDEPELAWHLYDGFEGRGFAHEAALAARADYHARISAQAPISYIDVTNARSEALVQQLGASREQTLTDDRGTYHIYRHPAPEAAA
ncbi:GNAT family N-acetyltransferase [Tabrizicola sp.]|uniref:GNAT family N-acetyltransferase n=1 Tax=Tabrizicola sp. TaxID=2005166 RepID=UPI0026215A63|nr:GNAT family N-acetyltransferase [Tabrizicola sp.]MDM7932649.1 GNAT family N-acetyltransferase [Tabrizicola sp.]